MSIDWQNKTVLITGGTGSFGQAFTRTMLEKYKVKKLIIFSRDEMKQFEMRQKMKEYNHRVRYFLGDIRDPNRLHRAFYKVDIIVHAAALKIVPAAEYNPMEAVQTNVIGSENVINLAVDSKVDRVIALSTDKAANPVNLYGATKLCAEKLFIAGNNYSPKGTMFSVVRYGNVFNSRGSVVPFFKECRKSGVVPITDRRMTRFWITLDQGVRFVMRSVEEMKGGEIYIPKLPSIRIVDIAEAICPDAEQKIVGIRPGEKLHETLVPADDGIFTYELKDRFISCPNVLFTKKVRNYGKTLDENFEGYRSDKNDQWVTKEALETMYQDEEKIHEYYSVRSPVH